MKGLRLFPHRKIPDSNELTVVVSLGFFPPKFNEQLVWGH